MKNMRFDVSYNGFGTSTLPTYPSEGQVSSQDPSEEPSRDHPQKVPFWIFGSRVYLKLTPKRDPKTFVFKRVLWISGPVWDPKKWRARSELV